MVDSRHACIFCSSTRGFLGGKIVAHPFLRSKEPSWVVSVAIGLSLVSVAVRGQDCIQEATPFATSDVTVDDAPFSVVSCDVDGDGDLDLVTANDASDTISVQLNDGQGTFGSLRRWTVASNAEMVVEPVDVTCCDFDDDGAVDLITANHTSDNVSILFNKGLAEGVPQFGAPVHYAVGEAPWAVRCVPIDGDSHPDIITADFTSDSVTVLTNDGMGGVSFEHSYAVAVGNGPRSMALCDFDGDNDVDVATGDFGGKTISLLRNDGIAGLVYAEEIVLAEYPYALTCCDLDGVNGPDLIVANIIDDSVTTAYNQTAFTFGDLSTQGVADGANAIACGDVNLDGWFDIVTANITSDDISIFTNNGSGALQAASAVEAASNPTSIVVAPVAGGPSVDVIVAFAEGVLVYENACGASGDADGDGDIDLYDLAEFQVCFNVLLPMTGCEVFDVNADDVIDRTDLPILIEAMIGPS